MKIRTCKFYNTEAKNKINLNKFMKSSFEQTDSVLKYFNKLKHDKLDEYLLIFEKRLSDVIKEFTFNVGLFNPESIDQNLTIITEYPELVKVISNYLFKLLKLPEGLNSTEEEIEIRHFNVQKASSHLSYYRVKTIEDMFGKDEATKLYKEIVKYLIKERKERNPPEVHEDPRTVTRIDSRERVMKQYRKLGVGDFTIVIYDDFKEFYKFDRCLVNEVLKEFNDPDIAYLSSCYSNDHPSHNEGYTINARKTQTLHHSDFCDEFYWNNVVYPNAKHPSLEFAKKLGKEDPNKLIKEYERI